MIPNELITLCWTKGFRQPNRTEADKIHRALQIHSSKVTPTAILNRFRPNERPEHKKYREDVYEPNTYGPFHKVLTQLKKIRLAEDWQVKYDDKISPNPLSDYCEGNYPKYDTLENFVFDFLLKRIVDDPNGVTIWVPENLQEILEAAKLDPKTQFRPRGYYYASEFVNVQTEQVTVLQFMEPKTNADGTVDKGVRVKAMLFLDKDEIVKVRAKSDRENDGYVKLSYLHKFGYMPVLSNGGIVAEEDVIEKSDLYDSFISPALPMWNEAIEAESDHKVDKALHLHPDRWEVQNEKCNAPGCKAGKIQLPGFNKKPEVKECEQCQGTGKRAAKSPFGVMGVSTHKVTADQYEQAPIPPAGYIDRPLESIKLTKEYADKKIIEGYAAINMEFLAEAPLNQSGTAKEFDRQELYAFVGDVAKHLVNNILKNAYFFCNMWLNAQLTEEQRKKYLPSIQTPRKFDLVSADVWQNRLKAAKENGASASARARAEIKAAEKQYGAESIDYLYIRDSIQLDPLYGLTAEEKTNAVMNNGCSHLDFIISTQINFFIRRAAIESADEFFSLEYAKKMETLKQYAGETRREASVTNTSFNPAVEA